MKELYHYDDIQGCENRARGPHRNLYNADNITGDCTGIFGDAKNIWGDVSRIWGDVSGISGEIKAIRYFYVTGLIGDMSIQTNDDNIPALEIV
jgi:hypothetical protein